MAKEIEKHGLERSNGERSVFIRESHSFPDPATLEVLERHSKGATERFITMAEKGQAHTHKRETLELALQFGGLLFAFLVCIGAFVVAYLIRDVPWLAAAIAGAPLAALVALFIGVIKTLRKP